MPQEGITLGLLGYILIALVVFILGAGAFYIFTGISGPKKIEEIEKVLNSGRIQAAIDELQKIIEKDDRNLKARYLMARAQRGKGAYGAAALELRQCLKFGKFTNEISEVKLRTLLAQTLLDSKQYNEAKNEFLLLTKMAPREYESFYQLGKLFFQNGDQAKAITFLTRATSLNVRHAESFSLLGQSHYSLNSYQDARAAFLKAVQLKSNYYIAHYYLGLCLRYLGDHDWAVKEFEKAEKDEAIRVKAILGKGMAFIDQEAYPRAIQELDRGVRFAEKGSDTEVNMRYLLALAAEKSRDMHTAIPNWEIIEKIRPGFRDVREKLKQYSEFRVDDSIKDFMILSNSQFEDIVRRIMSGLGYQIINIQLINDAIIEGLGVEDTVGPRAARKSQTLVHVIRDNLNPVSESMVRDFHENMKRQHAGRGLIMTAGDISQAAHTYAESRPIEIQGTSKLASLVREALILPPETPSGESNN